MLPESHLVHGVIVKVFHFKNSRGGIPDPAADSPTGGQGKTGAGWAVLGPVSESKWLLWGEPRHLLA